VDAEYRTLERIAKTGDSLAISKLRRYKERLHTWPTWALVKSWSGFGSGSGSWSGFGFGSWSWSRSGSWSWSRSGSRFWSGSWSKR
jgi:hypothetical protein